MPISCLYLACLYLNAVFLAIMASVVKLFTLLCSSEILINKTLSNCNTIAELMRLAFVAKKHNCIYTQKAQDKTFHYWTPFLTVSNRYVQAHVYIFSTEEFSEVSL